MNFKVILKNGGTMSVVSQTKVGALRYFKINGVKASQVEYMFQDGCLTKFY